MRRPADTQRNHQLAGAVGEVLQSVGRSGVNGVVAVAFKTGFKGFVAPESHSVDAFCGFEGANQYGFAHAFRPRYDVDAVVVVVNLVDVERSRRAEHGRVARCLAAVGVAGRVAGEVAFRLDDDTRRSALLRFMNQFTAEQELSKCQRIVVLVEVEGKFCHDG